MFHRDAVAGRASACSRCAHAQRGHASPAAPGSSASTWPTALRAGGVEVVIVDDFRTGRREFVADAARPTRRRAGRGRRARQRRCSTAAFAGCDWVFHLQANADVRHGLEHPRRDLEQNTIATSNVLEAMRADGVTRIAFSSTGSVYGEPEVFPTPEDAPFPIQTSLYAASKLAGEGMIAAYATATASPAGVPLRLDPRRALHPRPRVRLLLRAASATRPACACSATAARRSPTSTSRTASTRSCRRRAHEGEPGASRLQPRHRRDRGRRRIGRDHLRALGLDPEHRAHRRHSGAGRATAR